MKRILNSLILFLIALEIMFSGCSKPSKDEMTFAFYNVENLFDTINDPNTKDDRFVPGSDLHWDTKKYEQKLHNLARVIKSIRGNGLPSVLGLSEVENKKVIEDLLALPEMKGSGYKVIHKDSPDERGLDEALLYDPAQFKLVTSKYVNLRFPGNGYYTSAYFLYVKGITAGNDTLHIFLNHWISRWKGKEVTEIYRVYTAEKIRSMVEDIFNNDPRANIIIAGDFNDNPDDKSIEKALKALRPQKTIQRRSLYNLALKPYEKGRGTVYNGQWDMFDQIIVSTSMLTGDNGLQVTSSEQTIVEHDWMMKKSNGVLIPYRTATNKYLGGYSDHLPVYIRIRIDHAADLSSII